MSPFLLSIRWLVAFSALALLLTSCSVRSPIWSDSGELGPPLTNGSASRQVKRCDMVRITMSPTGGTTCQYAFQSADGTLIPFGEVHTEIGKSLALASQLRPHLQDFRKQYQTNPTKWVRYQNYLLYIVALRPTIIVGVPVDSSSARCAAPGGSECFRISDPKGWSGHAFSGWTTGVYYSRRPPVVAGSFAYIPESNSESVELPADSHQVTLTVANNHFNLVSVNGVWQFQP